MSKIAEKIHNIALQKAEEYSKTHGHTIIEEVAYGRGYKTAYIECYDQAIKDFLENACEWLEMKIVCYSKREYEELKEQFKNYMQNESEE